jgi:hypothetical protein
VRPQIVFVGKCLGVLSFFATMSTIMLSSSLFTTLKKLHETTEIRGYSIQGRSNAAAIVSRGNEQHHWQELHLDHFSVLRTYTVEDDKGKTLAKEVVQVEYRAPGTKTFTITTASGSAFIRGHVFKKLMKREAERAKHPEDRERALTTDNYAFDVLRKERVNGSDCTVIHAVPKRKRTYLFEGMIWIDERDFAVVKAAGRLSKSPSFWIKRVDFVRQYQKIGEFWLPQREQSVAKVRIYGTKVLKIDYEKYSVNQ